MPSLNGGNRIAHPKEKTIGHYEFTFNGEKAVICHGVGHLCELANAKEYGEQYAKWDIDKYPCIPEHYKVVVKDKTKTCYNYVKPNITRSLSRTKQKLAIIMSRTSSNKLTGLSVQRTLTVREN